MSSSPARRAPLPPRHQPRQTRLHGSGTATPEGSATQTITSLNPSHGPDGLVLRLRGAHSPQPAAAVEESEQEPGTQRRRTIQWAEDVIDNEGLGRKKSKVCCIFHKSREVGESSSEDDSSSSDSDQSDSSGGGDDGSARPVGGKRRGRRRGRKHDHEHKDGDGCGHGRGEGGQRKTSPNAYERMPRYDVKPLDRQPGS